MTVGIWDFTGLPDALNTALFGGTTAGLMTAQLMLTAFVAMMFLLPAMMYRVSPDVQITLIIFAVLICTGMGWLPITIMVVLIFIIALAWAGVFRKLVVG